ncbi:hypothetical protein SAMN04488063_0008 [Halopelagius inordinatus]|uniref:Uncharacterized protein n=1 Tax=Halopelagius inordinatus TaxID=553467 RepID=A0A1I2WUN5_9EURY|nr:hypothetical protein [Halopelagius inordinatus]SFH05058.1 hypothetical protein SAMN04488063_0008 [Halopelagius inordinatus]
MAAHAPSTESPDPDDSSDDVVILDAAGAETLTFDLSLPTDDAFEVALSGRDDVDQFRVEVTHDGTPLHAATVGESFFGEGPRRQRFVTTGARLIGGIAAVEESEAAVALTAALGNVHSRIVEGRLHVLGEHAREHVSHTRDVTYTPNGRGRWTVTFDDTRFNPSTFSYDRTQVSFPAAEWADTTTTPGLSNTVTGRTFEDEERGLARWQAARGVWMNMADVGEAPPSRIPITGADLRESGTLPQIDIAVDEFEDAVAEHDTLSDVRRAVSVRRGKTRILRHAVRALGLSDELDDVDADE